MAIGLRNSKLIGGRVSVKFSWIAARCVLIASGCLLSGCGDQQPASPSAGSQVAKNAPALAILNAWCAGDSDWNPPIRVVDRLIEKDGIYYTQHGSSNMQAEFAKATEWMPGMNGPDLLPVTVDGSELRYISADGWRYVTTVKSPTQTRVTASKSQYYNKWDATCRASSQ